ncbi:MAG: hypothetical protein LBQ94_07425 [Treponema sp.]|jgi:hypothetical protein|nr:hypothetical protein [Treponema sp.]
MSDNEKPREDDGTEKDIVFYYSREHRLSRAPEAVRALNDENYGKASIGKRIFGTKSNILILMSIVTICVMFTITSRYNSGTSVKLGANTLDLSVVREDEVPGLKMLKTVPKSGEFYIGPVDIAVSPMILQSGEGDVEIPPAFSHRFFFNPADKESFYISLPFDGESFFIILSTDDERKAVRVR